MQYALHRCDKPDVTCNHRQLKGIDVALADIYKAVPTSGSSTDILRWSHKNTELLSNSFSNYLHFQVNGIAKTNGLSSSQRSLPKGRHKYTTKEGTTILMIWPVSSYFLAWALTMFPKKLLQRLKSFQPQKNTARMLSLVQPQLLQHNV